MSKWIAGLFPWLAKVPSKTGRSGVVSEIGLENADTEAAVSTDAEVRRSGHVFISYKSEEKEKADAVKAYIEKLGYPCWMAPDSLHRRGTQDYGDDIHRAIRECRCLLFVLSPRALGSWWIRKEVQYAMAECRKPVIPFLIAPIPETKREEDSLFIDIHLEKQILNEEGARNGTMDLGVLNRYLASAFAGDGPAAPVADAAQPLPGNSPQSGAPVVEPARSASMEDWLRWQSLAGFHLERIRELKSVDPLHVEPTDLSPEARREELMLSSTEAALALMKILTTADPPTKDGVSPMPGDIRRTASRDLVRLVYENGDDFGPVVYEMAAPHAAEKPWAAFVGQARHYSPDGRTELKESNQAKARTFLEIAVRDSDNPYARIRMGECWHFGIGGDVSGSRALYWYREALKMECNDVLFRMSQLYFWGSFGIREDWTKAEELARQGIEAGVARCHLTLGDVLRDRSWKEGKQDYSAAEEEYAKAYEGGCRDALGRIFDLRFLYDWELTRPEFKNVDRLLQRASRASLADSFDAFVDRTFWGIDGTEANADIAIDYALAGVRQNSAHCGQRLGELLVQKAADEEAGEFDTSTIIAFAESNSELLSRAELQKFLGIFRQKTFPAGRHADFGKSSLPLGAFWTELFAKGALPSEVAGESRYSPFHFLEFLRNCPAKRDGDLDRVQRLWRAFRLLDDFQCAMNARELGLSEVFPPESLRLEEAALDHACAVLQDIPAALSLPSTTESLAQKIRTVESLLRREGVQNGSLCEEDVGREAMAFRRILRESSAPNNRLLHVARRLADLDGRLSHPFLAAALRLLRNAYLQKSGNFTGAEFGILFFVLNARYRDSSKNGGVLFAARDAFWQVIHRGSFDAVLPFLELCLFGCRIGDSAIPTDLVSIERIEPVLWELVETEKARTGNSGNREHCIRIAFAMSVIFLDRKFVTATGKENWGRSSLYSVPKAMEWLSTVLELGSMKGWEDICPELVDHARNLAGTLKDKGYVVVQEAIKAASVQKHLAEGEESRPGEIGMKTAGEATWQACIQGLVEQVKNSNLDAMGFSNVHLDGFTIDFAVSSDDKGVLFSVFPPDKDYVADDEGEKNAEPPKRSIDCLGPGGAISSCLIELLEKEKECLHRHEEDAEIRVAILASIGTIGSMQKKWGERIKASTVRLVPHDFFLTYLQSVFPALPAEGSEKPEESES